MKTISEDDWIDTYRPLPAPLPGAGFDFGAGDTLVDGHDPRSVRALICADDACIWTVVEGDSGMRIIAGRHLVNRIGHIITELPTAHPDLEVALEG